MNPINIDYYDQNADRLSQQYNSVSFDQVHNSWSNLLPDSGMVLDVGCGSGRDASALANKNLNVIAIDPSQQLLNKAKKQFSSPNITWLNDSLPKLSNVYKLDTKFDFILLSAVWMHIPSSERQRCFRKLAHLLNPNGVLVITLRHGNSPDDRLMYPVNQDEIKEFASNQGLVMESLNDPTQPDKLKRDEVSWETVALKLPDDGTGAFPLIRNIVTNDNKSSTYKLALLRSLIRIAEGHPGAALSRSPTHIELPLGLIALYWVKLYQPLINKYDIQQSSNAKKGLGFIKEDGWNALPELAFNDLSIGNKFTEPSEANAINNTIRDAAKTIRTMPVTYITIPGTKETVFNAEYTRGKTPHPLELNANYFASIGTFQVPINIWDNLTKYSVWIEPALINEWISTMSAYKLNQEKQFSKIDYLSALEWIDPVRSTNRVRTRVQELIHQNNSVYCCWSSTGIKSSSRYAIDHCFPYARWPNNDLWNLLPTKESINASKSDKLPSALKLGQSKKQIIDWWQMAWETNHKEFFTQANLSLPQLHINCDSYDDIFEAMMLQRARIREIQQLQEWG